jgi:methyl-accepting chemotaxis protein
LYGKGFAVVAQEVRNLASRSAEAAKEIKSIVEEATKKANEGKDIANEMIQGYKSLNDSINSTINLISDVEMSSKEQLSGIEQINDAVNQLDQQTQQNAAISTQTNDIAITSDKIAKLIVEDANKKEFHGKNDIVAKSIEQNSKKFDNSLQIKKANLNKISTKENSSKVIQSSTQDSDEWESF